MAKRLGSATARISEDVLTDIRDFARLRGVSEREIVDELGRKYISEPYAEQLKEFRRLRAEAT